MSAVEALMGEVLAEVHTCQPVTAPDIAVGIGADLRHVRVALGRLETRSLVVADDYQRRVTAWHCTEHGDAQAELAAKEVE